LRLFTPRFLDPPWSPTTVPFFFFPLHAFPLMPLYSRYAPKPAFSPFFSSRDCSPYACSPSPSLQKDMHQSMSLIIFDSHLPRRPQFFLSLLNAPASPPPSPLPRYPFFVLIWFGISSIFLRIGFFYLFFGFSFPRFPPPFGEGVQPPLLPFCFSGSGTHSCFFPSPPRNIFNSPSFCFFLNYAFVALLDC